MNRVMIVVNGPMCSGKSSLVKLIMKNKNFFNAHYDTIKWLISGYTSEDENYRKIAREITFSTLLKAIELDLSIVIDGGNVEYRSKYLEVANKYKYEYLSINLEAPFEVLKSRFLERIHNSNNSNYGGVKYGVRTLEAFTSRYDFYIKNKDDSATTYDSSKMTTEEIAKEIENLIN